MSDKVFLDSNIVVYSYSNSEIEKQKIAQRLIAENYSFISTQVLQELCNIITRKFKFSFTSAITAMGECCQNNNLHINSDETILQACLVADRYAFSFYDSLIIAAALESNWSILYSEDLQHDQIIDNKLVIKNPFK